MSGVSWREIGNFPPNLMEYSITGRQRVKDLGFLMVEKNTLIKKTKHIKNARIVHNYKKYNNMQQIHIIIKTYKTIKKT